MCSGAVSSDVFCDAGDAIGRHIFYRLVTIAALVIVARHLHHLHFGGRSAYAFDELVETCLRLVQPGIGDEGNPAQFQGRELRVAVGEVNDVAAVLNREPLAHADAGQQSFDEGQIVFCELHGIGQRRVGLAQVPQRTVAVDAASARWWQCRESTSPGTHGCLWFASALINAGATGSPRAIVSLHSGHGRIGGRRYRRGGVRGWKSR